MSEIIIGKAQGGKPVTLDLRTLIRTRMLVQANSGGGKSYLLRRLAEQLFGKVQVIIIDREGEFSSLRDKFGYLWVGKKSDGADTDADVRSAKLLAERILELRVSAVCDLFEAFRSRPLDRRAWLANFMEALIDAPRSMWRDLIVIVDEAHQFCPQENPKAASMVEREIIGRCKDAMIAMATVGRKRGYCAIWATQRLAKLDKDATAELFNRLIGMTIEDVDVDRAVDLMSVSKDRKAEFKESLKNLDPGHFFGFGRAIGKDRVLIKVGPVQTRHPEPGAQKQAIEPPPVPEKIRHLLPRLEDLPKEVETKAKTEADLRAEIRTLKGQLAARPVQIALQKPVIEHVEVPVVDAKAVNAVEVLIQKARAMVDRVGSVAGNLIAPLGEIRDALAKAKRAGEEHSKPSGPKHGAAPARIPAKRLSMADLGEPDPELAREKREAAATRQPSPIFESVNGFSRPQLAILRGMREFSSIGLDVVSRPQLAGWLGKKVSGSFLNDVGRLRQSGCLNYQGKELVLTGEGLKHAPPCEIQPTGEQIYERLCSAVTAPQKQILGVLWNAGPGTWISRPDVAEALGKRVSGSFLNDVGRLHACRMVEYQGNRSEERQLSLAMWVFGG